MCKRNNIVLIGMPGCGKSTIGVVLAKVMGFRFLDSDLLIQEREGQLLSQLIKQHGNEGFNRIENKVNASIRTQYSVIATGGSVVYGREAMDHLKKIGTVIYIRLPYREIEKRVGDLEERGISMRKNDSLEDVFMEREPLYRQYADIMIDTEGLSIKESVSLIKARYEGFQIKT